MNEGSGQLVDPLLEGLSEEQRKEALAAAKAAKRAEERAEQRAIERALKQKEEDRRRQRSLEEEEQKNKNKNAASNGMAAASANGLVFVSKRKRLQLQQQAKEDEKKSAAAASTTNNNETAGPAGRSTKALKSMMETQTKAVAASSNAGGGPKLSDREVTRIRETYLGKSAAEKEEDVAQKRKKQRTNKKINFRFRWDNTDDTLNDDDPLYAPMAPADHRSKDFHNNRKSNTKRRQGGLGEIATAETARTKPLHKMTLRDWRIFRENYEISVRGGKAPPPLRTFRESPAPGELPELHPALLDAIENVMRFKEPSPIQRQAITIGLQRRDLIGVAETGSGKTVAFGVPLCHYLLHLPSSALDSVAQEGPLALVMAPTRELALQIDVELSKLLSRQSRISTCAIVGGQPIQQQAQQIREGVHIIVGTPGRINDCIEMAYLVLNQCSYIVLDEADRMIDMGFAPQMETILDAMGGALKSENEEEAYRQEKEDLKAAAVAKHRLTAMFSATMPLEVEKMAKKYLRHPAVISIGDREKRGNARITQRVIFLSSPKQKEKALIDLLRDPRLLREKVIVFVNEKKHADGVGRMVERSGRTCVVMHGGKSQDQREENLEIFRRGGVVMVATDVAGRGLDIPDVAHVINFDLPTRSIENYTHRIGRTGRAGKVGLATSLITDEDEGIMAPLKSYLESTGNQVPDRLARHPAANANAVRNLID